MGDICMTDLMRRTYHQLLLTMIRLLQHPILILFLFTFILYIFDKFYCNALFYDVNQLTRFVQDTLT